MRYCIIRYPGLKPEICFEPPSRPGKAENEYTSVFDLEPKDGDRWLTPAETAAYLLGAPASSFPVEAPKDEELPS